LISISPYLFFIIKAGKIICWDYKNHQQYELDKQHFNRLVKISGNLDFPSSLLDQELNDANLLFSSNTEEEWGWDHLSKIFHFGTQISKNIAHQESVVSPEEFSSDYLQLSEETLATSPPIYIEREGEKLILPNPSYTPLEEVRLLSTLRERQTCRSFNKDNISIQTLSLLMHTVFGNIRSDADEYSQYGYEQIGLRKSSPSGGGLHSTEAYLLALHVEGLQKGIYHYQAHNHALTLIKSVDASSLMPALFCGQYFAQDLSLGVFLTSRFDKLWHKYQHSRAYRVALLDAGHLSQTFQLVATALKLNPWLSGAFVDEDVIELLELKSACEQPLFFVGAGMGPKSALDPVMKNLAAKQGKY